MSSQPLLEQEIECPSCHGDGIRYEMHPASGGCYEKNCRLCYGHKKITHNQMIKWSKLQKNILIYPLNHGKIGYIVYIIRLLLFFSIFCIGANALPYLDSFSMKIIVVFIIYFSFVGGVTSTAIPFLNKREDEEDMERANCFLNKINDNKDKHGY